MKKLMAFVVFFVIWCVFCALQEYVFKIDTDSYLMLYGFSAGSICELIKSKMQ